MEAAPVSIGRNGRSLSASRTCVRACELIETVEAAAHCTGCWQGKGVCACVHACVCAYQPAETCFTKTAAHTHNHSQLVPGGPAWVRGGRERQVRAGQLGLRALGMRTAMRAGSHAHEHARAHAHIHSTRRLTLLLITARARARNRTHRSR